MSDSAEKLLNKKDNTLFIVVPCYNEQEVLPKTCNQFLAVIQTLINEKKISDASRVLFVNDGSTDQTWQIIQNLAQSELHFEGISLSRNRGHQNALFAGLMTARKYADAVISIDCDGQDDIQAMYEMVDKWLAGADIVYGVRSSRKTDSFFKKTTAEAFYKLLSLMGVEVIFNHADYRLLNKRVLNELQSFQEYNLFLRGMIPLIGFTSDTVYYERHERIAGKSHYPLSKMFALAEEGITSLSIKPLHMISFLGICISLLSLVGIIWALISFCLGQTIQGWTSMTILLCFIGGIQLLALGVIGEYIGKIYLEVKHRPRFIISESTLEDIPTKDYTD